MARRWKPSKPLSRFDELRKQSAARRGRGEPRESRRFGLAFASPDLQAVVERLSGVARPHVEGLRDPSPIERQYALAMLADLAPAQCGPLAKMLLRDPETNVRLTAIQAIGMTRWKPGGRALKKLLTDKNASVRVGAMWALQALFPEDPRFTGDLYERPLRVRRDLFDRNRRIVFQKRKEKSRTYVFGGKLVGKVVLRIVSKRAFKAWRKAFKLGIPVEPMVLRADGTPRVKHYPNGNVRVFSRVVGLNVDTFLSDPENRQFRETISNQIDRINTRLMAAGIFHGDLRQENFCVRWDRVDGKRVPKVYFIDFELASMAEDFRT